MPPSTATSMGRYQILAEIGRGAMGVVYKARDPKIDRLVAIKAISLFGQEPEDEAEYRDRFYVEARAAGRLSHPGIVTIFDVGEEPENHEPYIVMEYVAGQSLSRVLTGQNKKLPLAAALQIAQELAEALDYAHSQGVVHRDIKPANIMVTVEGHAKIADFGIAKLNQAHMTLPGQVLGSPAYMAPEQLSGEGVDARSDLFSLGVILYNMITGFRPFQGNSATTVCFKVVNRDPLPASAYDSNLPPQVDRIVEKAMAKDPKDRYQSGAEMAREIQTVRQGDRSLQDATIFFKKVVQEQIGFSDLRAAAKVNGAGTATVRNRKVASGSALEKIAESGVNAGAAAVSLISLLPKKMLYGAATILILATGLITYETAHLKNARPTDSVAGAVPGGQSKASSISESAAENIREQVNRAATPDPSDASSAAPDVQLSVQANNAKKAAATSRTHSADSARSQPKAGPTIQPVAAKANIQLGTSTLQIHIEHPFSSAELSLWLDNKLIYTHAITGEAKKHALFHHDDVQEQDLENLLVSPGKHQLHVRVQSVADGYDQSRNVSGDFVASAGKALQIACDKHKDDLTVSLR